VPSFTSLSPASPRASAAARGSSKKQNTRCELILRRALTALGARYRIDVADLPGRPDIVFRRARVAVYCDGDFWHGRDLERRLAKLEGGHNAPYWVAKITGNVERDHRNAQALSELGWLVLRYWESDVHGNAANIAAEIVKLVRERRPLRG
jgi:DNA mismatch endonuclease (patch repair protein)